MAGGGVFITTLCTHALTVSIEQQIAGRIVVNNFDSRPLPLFRLNIV